MCHARRTVLLRSCKRMIKTNSHGRTRSLTRHQKAAAAATAVPAPSGSGHEEVSPAELMRSAEQLHCILRDLAEALGEGTQARQQHLELQLKQLSLRFQALQDKQSTQQEVAHRGSVFLALLALGTAVGTAAVCSIVEGQLSSYSCGLNNSGQHGTPSWESLARSMVAYPLMPEGRAEHRSTASGTSMPLEASGGGGVRALGACARPEPASHFRYQPWAMSTPAPTLTREHLHNFSAATTSCRSSSMIDLPIMAHPSVYVWKRDFFVILKLFKKSNQKNF